MFLGFLQAKTLFLHCILFLKCRSLTFKSQVFLYSFILVLFQTVKGACVGVGCSAHVLPKKRLVLPRGRHVCLHSPHYQDYFLIHGSYIAHTLLPLLPSKRDTRLMDFLNTCSIIFAGMVCVLLCCSSRTLVNRL